MNPDEVAHETEDVSLSVVVITENEADRVEGCLESVIAAARLAVDTFEVVLVDSASTDRTVELATEYPVTVLRIPTEHTVSCGAGRYVGDQVATGDLVLHVDGDMRLTETWLPRAVAYLRDHDEVAAVEGVLNESNQDGVRDVAKVGGVMLYDAAALEEVGGFDPYLQGYEDVDVGYRLTGAGYRLVRLPEVSAEHPEGEGTIAEPVRRWRHGYFFAPGQTIRKSIDEPRVLWRLLARQRFEAALLAWVVLGLGATTRTRRLGAWTAASIIGFCVLATRLGPTGAIQFLLTKAFGLFGLGYGLAFAPRSPSEFPLAAVEVIGRGTVFESGVRDSSR